MIVLVVTDLIMPEQDGLESIRLMKKEFPEIKIVVISGDGRIGSDTYLPAALELGADWYSINLLLLKSLQQK